MDRLGAAGSARRAPAAVFEQGIAPRYPEGGLRILAYMKSSGGRTANRFVSTTSDPTHAWTYSRSDERVMYSIDMRGLAHVISANEVLRRVKDIRLAAYGPYWMAHLPDGTRFNNLNTGEWIFKGTIPNRAIIRATIYRHGKAVQILDNPHYRGPLDRSARGGANAPQQ